MQSNIKGYVIKYVMPYKFQIHILCGDNLSAPV